MDTCKQCNDAIYPDDERVSAGLDQYHFECAESADIDEPSIEAESCDCGETAENMEWSSNDMVYRCPSCGDIQTG